MYKENPGADMYKTKVYIVETRNSAAGMRSAVATMAPLAIKLAKGEKLGSSKEAVSYTHLDVYKRQVYTVCGVTRPCPWVRPWTEI